MKHSKIVLSILMIGSLAHAETAQQESQKITPKQTVGKVLRIAGAAATTVAGTMFLFVSEEQITDRKDPNYRDALLMGSLGAPTLAHGVYTLYTELKPIAQYLYKKAKDSYSAQQ